MAKAKQASAPAKKSAASVRSSAPVKSARKASAKTATAAKVPAKKAAAAKKPAAKTTKPAEKKPATKVAAKTTSAKASPAAKKATAAKPASKPAAKSAAPQAPAAKKTAAPKATKPTAAKKPAAAKAAPSKAAPPKAAPAKSAASKTTAAKASTTKAKIAKAAAAVAAAGAAPAKKARLSIGSPSLSVGGSRSGARVAAAVIKPMAPKKTAAVKAEPEAAAAEPKKPVGSRHGFKLNEHVVYPSHGVGRIVGIEDQEIAGMALELFVITFDKDKMTLRVPTSKLESVGLRKLVEEPVLAKAMHTLKGRARVKRTMWSRRAQEYEAKINSGDLVSIAEVVRDLYRSESQPEQSYSERQLYEQALDRMARELAAVEGLDDRNSVERITDILSKSAKGRRAAEEAAAAAAEDGDDGDGGGEIKAA